MPMDDSWKIEDIKDQYLKHKNWLTKILFKLDIMVIACGIPRYNTEKHSLKGYNGPQYKFCGIYANWWYDVEK